MGKKLNVHTRITSLSSRVIFPFSHSLWNIPDEKNKDFSYVINPKHNTQEFVAQEHERIEQKLSIQFSVQYTGVLLTGHAVQTHDKAYKTLQRDLFSSTTIPHKHEIQDVFI